MAKKPSWDDIPSLQLEIEDDDTSAESHDNRTAVRLVSDDILKMLMDNAEVVLVQIATRNGIVKKRGVLQDINQGGLCFIMPAHNFKKNESIRVGMMLGRRVFKSKAIVRWVTKDQVGVEYIAPNPDDVEFLAELYSAKILNRV